MKLIQVTQLILNQKMKLELAFYGRRKIMIRHLLSNLFPILFCAKVYDYLIYPKKQQLIMYFLT